MGHFADFSGLLAIILVVATSGNSADQQFHCPNSGLPKVDEFGKPLQCLPGQAASEIVCGRGYSCYFSGFNYQCCPTAEEEDGHGHEYSSEVECPEGCFSVLTANGSPLLCNPRTLQCPQASMFCSSETSSISRGAICCVKAEGGKKLDKKAHQKLFASAQKIQFEEKVISLVNRDIHEECPINALMILSDKSEPVMCDEGNPCSQSEMFCHFSIAKRNSFCCQQIDITMDNLNGDHTHDTKNPLKYSPDVGKKLVDELKIQEELEKVTIVTRKEDKDLQRIQQVKKIQSNQTSVQSSTTTPGEEFASQPHQSALNGLKYADNEELIKSQGEEVGEKKVKAKAVRTQVDTQLKEEDTDIEYKPHNQGGYAISRKLDKINSRKLSGEHKFFAQQYLLEQIKNGWPYDEKFYRTESIAVLHKGSHPAAIVHFPNAA